MFNEKARKVNLEFTGKLPELLMKHGVKVLGSWSVPTEHLNIMVFEASSSEVVNKLLMEPEVIALSAFETYEIKRGFSMEEAMQMLQQMKLPQT
jgi:hypothetical protein